MEKILLYHPASFGLECHKSLFLLDEILELIAKNIRSHVVMV